MSKPEFSLAVSLEKLAARPTDYRLEANEEERKALAARFDLKAIDRLEASLQVARDSGAGNRAAHVSGRFEADVVQVCVVSGEDVPANVNGDIAVAFERLDEAAPELELEGDELDVLPLEGSSIDLGEAVAQSLYLSLDPYPRASGVALDVARGHLADDEELERQAEAERLAASPFAKLKR